LRSREGLGWLSRDGRERRVELGVAVPMAMGRSGSGFVGAESSPDTN
jgi:hypothetical protein